MVTEKEYYVRDSIANMEKKIEKEKRFLENGATEDYHYEMSKIRIEIYNIWIDKLENLLY